MLRFLLALVLALLPVSGTPAVTLPVLGVTIDGADVTSQLQSATWNLGIPDILSDLAPNTASLSFKGQLSVSPADAVVISAGGTAMWTGRLDSAVETRDTAGDYWTAVTATDMIGALGQAHLQAVVVGGGTGDSVIESLASTAGITIDVVDSSSPGLATLDSYGLHHGGGGYTGTVLEYVAFVQRSSNAIMALQHDGKINAWTREGLSSGLVTNGGFDTNTTGWSAVSGATISRVTASPYSGAGNLRVVTSSTQFSGSDFAITHTFRKGHTYRVQYAGRTISGSADINVGLGDIGASDRHAAVRTLTSSWVVYLTPDWTPTADRTSVTVNFRNNAAASNTFEIDEVYVTEIVNATDVSSSIVSWEKTTSIDVDINRWVLSNGSSGTVYADSSDAADVAAYGERTWTDDTALDITSFQYDDWIGYGGSQRPILTNGQLVVTSSSSPLLALDPLDWVNDGTDDWQIMSMSWTAEPGKPWQLTITGDNLIELL